MTTQPKPRLPDTTLKVVEALSAEVADCERHPPARLGRVVSSLGAILDDHVRHGTSLPGTAPLLAGALSDLCAGCERTACTGPALASDLAGQVRAAVTPPA